MIYGDSFNTSFFQIFSYFDAKYLNDASRLYVLELLSGKEIWSNFGNIFVGEDWRGNRRKIKKKVGDKIGDFLCWETQFCPQN